MTRFFIVRHGDTFAAGEKPRRIGARTDLPLAENGIRQAERLGRHFAGAGIVFSVAMAGHLRRTWQTAELILAACPNPPVLHSAPVLVEIDHGPDEKRPESEVVDRIGSAALVAWINHAIAPNGWTVSADARLADWRSLFQSPPAGDTLLVTSSGASRFAAMAIGVAVSGLPRLRTGAFAVVERVRPAEGADGLTRWVVKAWDIRPGEPSRS